MITTVILLCALILLTYAVYPAIVLALSNLKEEKTDSGGEFTGHVYIFMAAHNEEAVIRNSLDRIAGSDFPSERITVNIGSDASTDQTNNIIRKSIESGALDIRFSEFEQRQGKPAIINQLVEKANDEQTIRSEDLFLLMDANISLDARFISELSKVFSDEHTGLADGVLKDASAQGGIAGNERQYLQIETRIKLAESKLWGCAMGPFGGAYMIRPALFRPVPDNFLVDDFFIFFHVISEGYFSRVVPSATCSEAISGDVKEEFRRKTRISAGNFQNTAFYFAEMVRFWKMPNLVFILHKLLRWLSPLFGLTIIILLAVMAVGNPVAAKLLLIMISLLVGLPIINYLFNKLNLSIGLLQGFSYLIIMNIALLAGFFKYLKGVRTNVWEPTKRAG